MSRRRMLHLSLAFAVILLAWRASPEAGWRKAGTVILHAANRCDRPPPVSEAERQRLGAALLRALQQHDEGAALALVEQGADVNAAGVNGIGVLSLALALGYADVATALAERGADGSVKDRSTGRTPLMDAAECGFPGVVRALLAHRAKVDARDVSGCSALTLAAMSDRAQIVRMLLDERAQVDLKDGQERTALMHAVELGHTAVVRALLERGAGVDIRDAGGRTPLICAVSDAMYGGGRVVMWSGGGGRWFYTGRAGMAPANTSRLSVVRLLLDRGADPNVADRSGMTPLIWAALGGRDEAIHLLLVRGANPRVKDRHGRTALEWAEMQGRYFAAELIRKAVNRA
jgi:uncharacterized protein